MNTPQDKTSTQTALDLVPADWEGYADGLTEIEKERVRRDLEAIAERAAMLAAYLDSRHGYGGGDQGHEKAVKAANRAGRIVWVNALCYNDHTPLTI